MNKIRVIARLDIKNEFVIKGIHLEGLRKIGDPNELAKKYYKQGADEIIFMDAVAAYYDRNSLNHILEKTCEDVFVPITVGGGIRSIEDIQNALKSGADKVAINTKAIQDPVFLETASKIFGSQCIIVSIEAKKIADGKWEAYVDNGREPTGLDVMEWSKQAEGLGAGEILITSVDADGTKRGFDIELNAKIASQVCLPVIASGGAGSNRDVIDLLATAKVSALSVASLLHYDLSTIGTLKRNIHQAHFKVRL